MSVFAVDASVGIKWFVPEIHSTDALRVRDPGHQLHVPTLFDVEIASILWKKIQRRELSRTDADDILAQVTILPVVRHPELPLLPSAFDLANQTRRTVYDCLYVALAIQLGGQAVTADQRLINALSATSWSAHIVLVQDVP
jgi:predicted nucleic acid-binding protein